MRSLRLKGHAPQRLQRSAIEEQCAAAVLSPSAPEAAWESSSLTTSRARCRLKKTTLPTTSSKLPTAAARRRERASSICLKRRCSSSR
eukprot:scaffold280012_cov24-Tisochrysis_lutea.AAC.2